MIKYERQAAAAPLLKMFVRAFDHNITEKGWKTTKKLFTMIELLEKMHILNEEED